MRHSKSFNHLGRKSAHRKAMLANMASSLLIHKKIETTLAKAKALRTYIEPLITKTKNLASVPEKTHAQRVVFSYLQDKNAVKELFGEIAEKVANRPGGYTRILKTGNRLGDNAEMCIIELVDYNEAMLSGADAKKSKSRRRRSSVKKKSETPGSEKAQETIETKSTTEIIEEKSQEETKAEESKPEENIAETKKEATLVKELSNEENIPEIKDEKKPEAESGEKKSTKEKTE